MQGCGHRGYAQRTEAQGFGKLQRMMKQERRENQKSSP